MNEEQMYGRCPDARLLGVGVLRGYQLDYTIFSHTRNSGCADVLPRTDSTVYGLVYALTQQDSDALDIYEGVPEHYIRTQVQVYLDEEPIPAFTYMVRTKTLHLKPSLAYISLLQNAARKYSFPESYQIMLSSTETQ